MRKILFASLGMLIVAAPALAAGKAKPNVEYLSTEATLALKLPFSEAVRVGNTLYLSGVVGLVPGTRTIVAGGIEPETKQVLDTIKTVLERNGSSLDRVVKCTVMLADMAQWAKMNTIYMTYFTKHFPARSAMGVNGLALGAQVEIECIATVD